MVHIKKGLKITVNGKSLTPKECVIVIKALNCLGRIIRHTEGQEHEVELIEKIWSYIEE